MSTISSGFFVTFEGGEGAGKSTQIRMLAARLRGEGHTVLETAEPGGTGIGRQIRRVFLDARNENLSAAAELLLVFAARAQNVEESIRPALAEGRVVLCDRFTDSTLVYQGAVRGLGAEAVLQVDRIACGGLRPHLTFYLDIDPETGLARARLRNAQDSANPETRLDDQDLDFHRRVREAYLELARAESGRIVTIDASAAPEAVAAAIWNRTAEGLASHRLHH